jgi:hypothetical protein
VYVGGIFEIHTTCGNDDCDNKTVDTKDTSHNHRDDGLHDHLRTHDTHGSDSNARLGSSISSSKVCHLQQQTKQHIQIHNLDKQQQEKRRKGCIEKKGRKNASNATSRNILANTRAEEQPIIPKKAAEGGQLSKLNVSARRKAIFLYS